PEQVIDQFRTLVGVLVREEYTGLDGGRQRADDIEINTAQERGVVDRAAGRDAKALQLVPDVTIDEVILRRSREAHPGPRDGDAANGHLAAIAHQNGGLARDSSRLDQAAPVNAGDDTRVGLVLRLGGDAVPSALNIDGGDAELLHRAEREDALTGFHLQPGQCRQGGRLEALSLGKPAQDAPVREAVWRNPAPAAVRHEARGLAQQQGL